MQKRFRVPGRLALKLKEHGVSVAAVLRKAGLPGDLFEQTRAKNSSHFGTPSRSSVPIPSSVSSWVSRRRLNAFTPWPLPRFRPRIS